MLEKSRIELRGTDKVVPVNYCSELLGTEIFRGECCKEKQACSVSHQHTSVEEPLYTQRQ